jgi:deoxyribodipyrimidine photo-lyase
MSWFSTDIEEILRSFETFDPSPYAKTRNFKDGSVSRFSPYISRGFISTKYIFDTLKSKFPKSVTEKFLQELLWREYFQRLLQCKPELYANPINQSAQVGPIAGMPIAILNAASGIREIDNSIEALYATGYMHNHYRLYVAALCCNNAKTRFDIAARWMYYHLLDADIASNYCSWQWVAGNLTGKKYYTNQDNINFYSKSVQTATFLDKSYESIASMDVPARLKDYTIPILSTYLTETALPVLNSQKVLLYNFYNLDPFWHDQENVQRVLILEPSHFEKFPVSEKVLDFFVRLSANIPNLIFYCGAFETLKNKYPEQEFIAKEHPLLTYDGATIEARDWIVPKVSGFYPSFSKYYKECLKHLNHD